MQDLNNLEDQIQSSSFDEMMVLQFEDDMEEYDD